MQDATVGKLSDFFGQLLSMGVARDEPVVMRHSRGDGVVEISVDIPLGANARAADE